MSAGQIGADPAPEGQQLNATVRARSRLQTPEQFRNIIVKTQTDGSVVHLSDVARVELGAQDYSLVTTLNGQQNAAFGIYLQPGANALDTAEAVERTMQRLAKRFPEGIT